VVGIAAMGKAFSLLRQHMDEEVALVRRLRDAFEGALFSRIPELVLNGHPTERLPNTVNLSFRYVEGEALLLNLDMLGIACSSGSACTSGSLEASPILLAMGADPPTRRERSASPWGGGTRTTTWRTPSTPSSASSTSCGPCRRCIIPGRRRRDDETADPGGAERGVDSSVAALLLQREGWEVVGVSMDLYDYSKVTRTGRGRAAPSTTCTTRAACATSWGSRITS